MPPPRLAVLLYIPIVILGITFRAGGTDLPLAIDTAARQHIEFLDHQQWQVRESSQRWLIENSLRWVEMIPGDWVPDSAEAAWRWQRIGEILGRLAEIRVEFSKGDGLSLKADATGLARDAGAAFEAAIGDCLADPDSRVRSGAVSLLPTLANGGRLLRRLREDDPSPEVRRSLLRAIRTLDIDGGRNRILRFLATDRSTALRVESLRAARELADPLLLPALEDLSRKLTGIELELSLTRVVIGGATQLDAIEELLVSGNYQQRHRALDALVDSGLKPSIELLQPLLRLSEADLRHRALSLIERHGVDAAALSLLPLLENRSLARWSIHQMIRLDSQDYFADIAAALEKFPIGERCARIQLVAGVLRLVPVTVRGEELRLLP